MRNGKRYTHGGYDMKMRKKVLLTIFIICLLTICICTVPFPKRVDITLSGTMYTEQMEFQESTTMTVRGYQMRYLLREDTLNVTIRCEKVQPDLKSNGMIFVPENGYGFTSIPYYESSMNRYDSATFAFTDDFSEIVLLFGSRDCIFVASADPDMNDQEILQNFDFLMIT